MYFTFAEKKRDTLLRSQWSPRLLAFDCATRELYYTCDTSSSWLSSKSRTSKISSVSAFSNHSPDLVTSSLNSDAPLEPCDTATAGRSLPCFFDCSSNAPSRTSSGLKNSCEQKRDPIQWKKVEVLHVSPLARDEPVDVTKVGLNRLYQVDVHGSTVTPASFPPWKTSALLFPSAGPVRSYAQLNETNSDFLEDPFFQKEMYERVTEVVMARRREEETERMRRRAHGRGTSQTVDYSTPPPSLLRPMGQSISYHTRDHIEEMAQNTRAEAAPEVFVSYGESATGTFQREAGERPLNTEMGGGVVQTEDSGTYLRDSHSPQHNEHFSQLSSAASNASLHPTNSENHSSLQATDLTKSHPFPEVNSFLVFSFSCEWEYWRFFYITSLVLGLEGRQHRPHFGLPPYDPRNGIGLCPLSPQIWCKLKWLRGYHYPYIFVHGNLMGLKKRNKSGGSEISPINSSSRNSTAAKDNRILEVAVPNCYLSVTHDDIFVFNVRGKPEQWISLKYIHTVLYNSICSAPFVVFLSDDQKPDIIFLPTSPPVGTFLGKEREKFILMMLNREGIPSISSVERRGNQGNGGHRTVSPTRASAFSSHISRGIHSSERVPEARQTTGVDVSDGHGTSSHSIAQTAQHSTGGTLLNSNHFFTFSSSALSSTAPQLVRGTEHRECFTPPLTEVEGESSSTDIREIHLTGDSEDEIESNISPTDLYSRWSIKRLAYIIRKTCFGTVETRRVVEVREIHDTTIYDWVSKRLSEELLISGIFSRSSSTREIPERREDLSRHYDPQNSGLLSLSRSTSVSSRIVPIQMEHCRESNSHFATTTDLPAQRRPKLDLVLADSRVEPYPRFPMMKQSMRDAWITFHSSLAAIREFRDRAPLESSSEVIMASMHALPMGSSITGLNASTAEGAIAVPLYDTLANDAVAPLTPAQVDFARCLLEGEAERDDAIVGVAMESLADVNVLEELGPPPIGVRSSIGSGFNQSLHSYAEGSTTALPTVEDNVTVHLECPLPSFREPPESQTIHTASGFRGPQGSAAYSASHSRIRYFRESRDPGNNLPGEGQDADEDREGLYGSQESHYIPAPHIQWMSPSQ